jgi:hypothetical protein
MLSNWNYEGMPYTMLKKTVQQGRSERRGEIVHCFHPPTHRLYEQALAQAVR